MTWTAEKGKRKLMKLLKNWVSHTLQAQWYLHICHIKRFVVLRNMLSHIEIVHCDYCIISIGIIDYSKW